jgi:hypothetical protein
MLARDVLAPELLVAYVAAAADHVHSAGATDTGWALEEASKLLEAEILRIGRGVGRDTGPIASLSRELGPVMALSDLLLRASRPPLAESTDPAADRSRRLAELERIRNLIDLTSAGDQDAAADVMGLFDAAADYILGRTDTVDII